jgi:Arc/MetJ-type ribon-helix-helix transcriptional regulator
MQIDRGRPGSTLSAWMSLPWGGPQQIVLPGFHTAAESALKRGSSGDELFTAVCGLMATGARTVLLSRWRTGGQTSYDLVREFVQELPYTSASEAWQRSVQLLMHDEVVLEREPRVKAEALDSGIQADHPFFWGAYLLVDTGSYPATHERRVKPAARKEDKPAADSPKAPPTEKEAGKPAAEKGAPEPKPEKETDKPPAAEVKTKDRSPAGSG